MPNSLFGGSQSYDDFLAKYRNRVLGDRNTSITTTSTPKNPDPRTAGESLLRQGRGEANRLQAEEEGRGYEAEEMIRGAGEKANVPTITQRAMDQMFSVGADASGKAFLDQVGDLGSAIGANGLDPSSGVALGVAADLQASRLASNADVRRNVFLRKVETDALDRTAAYGRSLDLAQQHQRTPSSVNLQFMGEELGYRRDQQGTDAMIAAAKASAKAQEKAGKASGAGGLIQGAMGLFGG
jgi:hypothetical protein